MKIVKITVLDTSLREDLVKKYGNPQLKPCGVLKAGDNEFAIVFPDVAAKGTTFNDFAVYIKP